MRRGPLITDLDDDDHDAPRAVPDPGAPRPRETSRRGPVHVENDAAGPGPQDAPPPPESPLDPADAGFARALAAQAEAQSRGGTGWIGPLLRWSLGGILSMALSLALWDFSTAMLERNPILGTVATVLVAGLLIGLLAFALREIAAIARLRKAETARNLAARALAGQDREGALAALRELRALWTGRSEMGWPLARLAEREPALMDAPSLLHEAERLCLAPLDEAARRAAVEGSRQVAAATAFSPVPFVDVAAALYLNLAMIRRIARIYGGRGGALGALRLLRAVTSHLAATGAVAIGDDILGPALGGGVLAKVSRRFGEGLVNGALTARVGVAAIEVCRPLPFDAVPPPKARGIVAAALGDWAPK